MTFVTRYLASLNATNLMNDDRHHHTDALAAMAMTGRIGSRLFRVRYDNDAEAYARLLDDWIEIVRFRAVLQNWPAASPPAKVAKRALDHWMFDVCPTCTGRAFEPLPGNPRVLSDRPCPACHGTGRSEVVIYSPFHRNVAEMVDYLQDLHMQANADAAKRLRVT